MVRTNPDHGDAEPRSIAAFQAGWLQYRVAQRLARSGIVVALHTCTSTARAMNTQLKKKAAAHGRKHPTSQQPPNAPPGTPPQQPEPGTQPDTQQPQPEIQQPNIPERPAERPDTPQ